MSTDIAPVERGRRAPARVFISYRTDLSQEAATIVEQALTTELGADAVFRDRSWLAADEKWRTEIKRVLADPHLGCAVVLVPHGAWGSTCPSTGKRRWGEDDIFMLELRTLLQLESSQKRDPARAAKVIFVGHNGGAPPDAADLAQDLSAEADELFRVVPEHHFLRGDINDDVGRDEIRRTVRRVVAEHIGAQPLFTVDEVAALDKRDQRLLAEDCAREIDGGDLAPVHLAKWAMAAMMRDREFAVVAERMGRYIPDPQRYLGTDDLPIADRYWRAFAVLTLSIAKLAGARPRKLTSLVEARRLATEHLLPVISALAALRNERDEEGRPADDVLGNGPFEALVYAMAVWVYVLEDYFRSKRLSVWNLGAAYEGEMSQMIDDLVNGLAPHGERRPPTQILSGPVKRLQELGLLA